MILAHAAKLTKLSNRKNAAGGNIGRVVKGMVPAHRPPYGYRSETEAQPGPFGRLLISSARWVPDQEGLDGDFVDGSPAWVVARIFTWIGLEGRTLHWVARQLNALATPAPAGRIWSPALLNRVLRRRTYTGNTHYNRTTRVSNPARPLGD